MRERVSCMSIPVGKTDVERALRPWLGSLFLYSCSLCDDLTERLQVYAPYRQSLESLRDELESLLVTSLNRETRGSMTILSDNYHSVRLGTAECQSITDDLMGVVFEKLTPFSANFIKINDYSLRVQSLSALRVLCTRYASYYTPEEYAFIARMIRTIYPPRLYEGWLKD